MSADGEGLAVAYEARRKATGKGGTTNEVIPVSSRLRVDTENHLVHCAAFRHAGLLHHTLRSTPCSPSSDVLQRCGKYNCASLPLPFYTAVVFLPTRLRIVLMRCGLLPPLAAWPGFLTDTSLMPSLVELLSGRSKKQRTESR